MRGVCQELQGPRHSKLGGHWISDCWKKKKEEKKEDLASANAISSSDSLGTWTIFSDSCQGMLNIDSWILDSGASHHFVADRNIFVEYKPLPEPLDATVGKKAATFNQGATVANANGCAGIWQVNATVQAHVTAG